MKITLDSLFGKPLEVPLYFGPTHFEDVDGCRVTPCDAQMGEPYWGWNVTGCPSWEMSVKAEELVDCGSKRRSSDEWVDAMLAFEAEGV